MFSLASIVFFDWRLTTTRVSIYKKDEQMYFISWKKVELIRN